MFLNFLVTLWCPKIKKDGRLVCQINAKKDVKRSRSSFRPSIGRQPFFDTKRSPIQKGRQKVVALACSFSDRLKRKVAFKMAHDVRSFCEM